MSLFETNKQPDNYLYFEQIREDLLIEEGQFDRQSRFLPAVNVTLSTTHSHLTLKKTGAPFSSHWGWTDGYY